MKLLKLFLIYTLACFFLGQLCYWIIQVTEIDFSIAAFPFVSFSTFGNQPYGSFYKMPSYHWDNPTTYWWVMSSSFGAIAAVWKLVFAESKRWLHILTGILVVPVSVVLASIPSSMLWAYHDMQSGRLQENVGSFQYMIEQVPLGLQLALPLYIISVPFNILATATALFVLFAKNPLKKLKIWSRKNV